MVLIHKNGKDPAIPQSYHPISLLNVDYKILVLILVARSNRTMSKYIHTDQSSFLPGRYLNSNIRPVMNIIDYAKRQQEPLLMFFADSEKTFDQVAWPFMERILEEISFGNNMRQWIKMIYTKQTTMTALDGYFSERIEIGRGVRQGCPLSPILFNLIIEVLANNSNFSG